MSDTDIFQQFSSFEALHDSVFLIDSGGLVVAANISALKMLVLTETQLIGSPFSDYFPNAGERFQEGNGEVIEITGRRSDGSGLLLEGRSSVAYYNDSRCYLLVLRDRHGGVSLEEKQSSAAFDNTATRWANLVEFCSRIRQQVESGAVPLDRTAMVIAISLGRLGFLPALLAKQRAYGLSGRRSIAWGVLRPFQRLPCLMIPPSAFWPVLKTVQMIYRHW